MKTVSRGAALLLMLAVVGCKNTEPEIIGLQNGALAHCPQKPNCVLSQNPDADHSITPLAVAGSIEEAKAKVKAALAAYDAEGVEVVTDNGNYLYATFTTPLMKYVDDTEFLFMGDGIVHVRSASRVGHSDLGANAERIERLRKALR
jgi:uncharacterized protein (DUF1499 family)